MGSRLENIQGVRQPGSSARIDHKRDLLTQRYGAGFAVDCKPDGPVLWRKRHRASEMFRCNAGKRAGRYGTIVK